MVDVCKAVELYQRYGRALLRKAERILQSREDAEDIVQQLFLDLVAEKTMTTDLPYLYRAITNRSLNVLRHHKTRARLLKHESTMPEMLYRRSCEGRVMSADLLVKLVDKLDAMAQEIVIYYYLDDMSQEEVATLLGTSRKTVGKRLAQIKSEVKRLSDEGGEVAP